MKNYLPTRKDLGVSTATILLASLILGSMALIWGLNVAAAGYLAMLFLSPALGKMPLKDMFFSLLWLLIISLLGLVVAPLGYKELLLSVVFASIVQGIFVFGTASLLNRSATTVVALSLTHSDSIWQPLLGVMVGGLVIIAIGAIVFSNPTIQPMVHLTTRLKYGVYLAVGASIITLIWITFDLKYLQWALILFSLMFTFDRHDVIKYLQLRAGGALVGTVIALALALVLPRNVIIILAIAFAILELAYLAENQIFLRMMFLTATLMFVSITLSAEDPRHEIVHRVFAIIAATATALLLHFLIDKLSKSLKSGVKV